ncbi:MAG: VTT domain-containing protein [bacterium]|nr:VTT domain-containing protein [bacterium]
MKTKNAWRRFFLIAGPVILAAALIVAFVPAHRNLAGLFLFTIVSNTVVPMPYEPIMIYMGMLHPPFWAALAAALGNLIACFLDYRAINYAFQHRRLQKIRDSEVYRSTVHHFLKLPFLSILVAAFAPFIPFYIFRVLSPTSGYPLRRYMGAVFLGRLPRYYLFAFMGSVLIPSKLLAASAIILIVCVGLYLLVQRHLIAKQKYRSAINLHSDTPPLEARY